ncbi:hypothetical protein HOH87_05290 [bacterium]|jgi:ATP-dependent DNA helicase DinG|nr:hypothetical protein [bacterium]
MPTSKPIICVDIETTGLAPNKDKIIEIGAVKIHNGKIVARYQTLLNPQRNVPPFVLKLTGINPNDLKKAPLFEDIYEELVAFVGTDTFMAHGIAFDFDTINTELDRIGQPPLTNSLLDSLDLALLLYPNLSSHKLSSLATHCDLVFEDAHRALADAEMLANVALQMAVEFQQINPIVLREAIRVLSPEKDGLKAFLETLYHPSPLGKSLDYKRYLATVKKDIVTLNRSAIPNFPSSISDWFQSQQFGPGTENRPTQQAMSEFIQECFDGAQHGVVEAGTGIGKSRAYLIPALVRAITTHEPVIISTKTKHLQSQLVAHEIPLLEPLFPPFSTVVVKGKENYIDIQRFDLLYRYYLTTAEKSDTIPFLGLLSWILQTKTGDLSELHPSINRRFINKVRYTSDSEQRRSNPLCFVHSIRQRAKSADLIITNHAFLFSDLNADTNLLPNAPVVIFDEAHSIEDIATQTAAKSYTIQFFSQFRDIIVDKKKEGLLEMLRVIKATLYDNDIATLTQVKTRIRQTMNQLEKHHKSLMTNLLDLAKTQNKSDHSGRLQIPISDDVIITQQWQTALQIQSLMIETLGQLNHHFDALHTIFDRYNAEQMGLVTHLLDGVQIKLQRYIETLNDLFLNDSDHIVWLDCTLPLHINKVSLQVSPVNMGSLLNNKLYSEKRSVIAVSASLCVNKSFDFFLERSGLNHQGERCHTLRLESDYNYGKQAKAYCPTDLNPKELSELITSIVEIVGKRSLVLYTSKNSLNASYQYIKRCLGHQTRLFCQTVHGSREAILQQFKVHKGPATILGVDSFWEGVDLAGDLLSCLIIPKLPFPVPSEPLHMARIALLEADGKNGFKDYMLPLTILKFRQGIGRLIRSKTDHGLLFILDERLQTRSYATLFKQEIAAYNTAEISSLDSIEDAKQWLNKTPLLNQES